MPLIVLIVDHNNQNYFSDIYVFLFVRSAVSFMYVFISFVCVACEHVQMEEPTTGVDHLTRKVGGARESSLQKSWIKVVNITGQQIRWLLADRGSLL